MCSVLLLVSFFMCTLSGAKRSRAAAAPLYEMGSMSTCEYTQTEGQSNKKMMVNSHMLPSLGDQWVARRTSASYAAFLCASLFCIPGLRCQNQSKPLLVVVQCHCTAHAASQGVHRWKMVHLPSHKHSISE